MTFRWSENKHTIFSPSKLSVPVYRCVKSLHKNITAFGTLSFCKRIISDRISNCFNLSSVCAHLERFSPLILRDHEWTNWDATTGYTKFAWRRSPLNYAGILLFIECAWCIDEQYRISFCPRRFFLFRFISSLDHLYWTWTRTLPICIDFALRWICVWNSLARGIR